MPEIPSQSALRDRLLAMQERDLELRQDLARTGELFEGYDPRMRAVHEENADGMRSILRETGWPTEALVGRAASDAAWLVVQHAISRPDLMRDGFRYLQEACDRGAGNVLQLAMLEDRICYMEGRPQPFGTTLDWNDDGELSPGPLRDAASVDERRQAVGLEPLADALKRAREEAAQAGECAPEELDQRKRQAERFAIEVGWR